MCLGQRTEAWCEEIEIFRVDKCDYVELILESGFNREHVLSLTDTTQDQIMHPNTLGVLPPELQVFGIEVLCHRTFLIVCGKLLKGIVKAN